ncbi:MAG: hypothetical protein ACREBZ_03085, partial [Thermoplasmata archaeon]
MAVESLAGPRSRFAGAWAVAFVLALVLGSIPVVSSAVATSTSAGTHPPAPLAMVGPIVVGPGSPRYINGTPSVTNVTQQGNITIEPGG